MARRIGILTIIMIAIATLLGCTTSAYAEDPLETVGSLDLEKYLGRWYEIARYQHGFERNIVGATAEYSKRSDGRIQVVNSGFKKTLDGPYTSVKAVAWRPDDKVPGALKVRFFGLFAADYLVFGLDEEYRWALVGSNDRNTLWFLARTPEVSNRTLDEMKAIAVSQGYDLSELFMVPQKER